MFLEREIMSVMSTTIDRAAGDDDLLRIWRERFGLPVSGWNFAELAGEMTGEDPPWSYPAIAREHLRHASNALDMGTGGGELLLAIADALPDDTVATEGWQPNLSIATEALAPEGVRVVFYDAEAGSAMPFGDNRFDIVLNCHEAYDTTEVHRVLRPDGCFVTQQVDGRNLHETQQLFGGSTNYPDVTLANFSRHARDAGFVIERSQEWVGKLAFASVAAMIRYFAIVPWEVPDDFSVDQYAEKLLDLHRSKAELVFTQRRFLLIARA